MGFVISSYHLLLHYLKNLLPSSVVLGDIAVLLLQVQLEVIYSFSRCVWGSHSWLGIRKSLYTL
jgi:hypothetical protein